MKQLRVEHFNFEQDFMEDNIRCIPMIVRFKLDACGIKLKLKEWNKMTVEEREQLAVLPIDSLTNLDVYRIYLRDLIFKYTGEDATSLPADKVNNYWASTDYLPPALEEKLEQSKMCISLAQWKNLNVLQRFALLKLTRSSHENKNFPKAMKEFGLD
ncbi:MAG: nitrate reductase associated protein [Bacteroidetes bacterium]|nr:nitrate reductase associated protein [Bacteroidota bacterium]